MFQNEPLLIDDKSKYIVYTKDLNRDEPIIEVLGSYLVPLLGKRTFDGHIYISGATGAGKSYFIRKIIDNDAKGRKAILFTDLESKDPAFEGMNYIKFDEKNPKANSQWLKDNLNNKIMIFDDVQFNEDILYFRDKMLEKGRHRGVVVICVNHKLQDYWKSKVPLNECRFIVCFPGTNRGACARFLKDELEINKHKIQSILDDATKSGRQLILHRFSPNFVATTNSIYKI